MRFIVMHKVDPAMEAGAPPDQAIINGMGTLIGESLKSGVFLDGAGLHPSAQRVRVSCRGGDCMVARGPLTGGNELVSSFVMIKVKSMEQAIEYARELVQAVGDLEIDIGPVVEPWDIGYVPRPEHIESSRFLLLLKSNAASEAGRGPDLAKLTAPLAKAGVLLKSESLAPSRGASRLPVAAKGGKRTWVDGPFAESKEMIAGFSILSLPAKADALAWAERYADILKVNEVDVRELA
jgi:hypothetical protein